MTKITDTTDAALLALIARHDQMWTRIDAFHAEEDSQMCGCPEHVALAHAAEQLAVQIIATPCSTRQAVAGKLRVAHHEDFDHDIATQIMLRHDLARVEAAEREAAV
ncbi:hypothetical protein [Bradyrhizobium sp. ORS 86]|uniref:hypothetical protein n=1 Tax=Bradyrhizobium sp. ORS 86 TaxID=1685970 RepID=UPI00388F6061